MKSDFQQSPEKGKRTPGIFTWVTNHPKLLLTIGILFIVTCLAFIPTLQVDPRAESFLPEDHNALQYREKVEDIFGLTDPMVIAIVDTSENGIFNPQTLALIQQLTEAVSKVQQIDNDSIVSLATEDNITGNDYGMEVEPFLKDLPTTQEEANAIRDAVMDFPLYIGSLVSRDASTTLVVTETPDETVAPVVYETLLEIANSTVLPESVALHVAGDGAVSGYLSSYIIADASRLVPISVVVITLLCFIAFRTLQGLIVPTIVIVAAAASAVGLMAAFGFPIYVITTSLPILLVGIAVADSIHILSEYYEDRARNDQATQKQLIVRSISRMWRPVTLTTVTSMIGFLGVYASSYMPPMQAFGLFAMVGLGVAGFYSLIIVPATQVFFKPKLSKALHNPNGTLKEDSFSKIMTVVGDWVLRRSKLVLTLASAACIAGVFGAMQLQVNESWVDNFKKSDPIYQADQAINATMDGTNNLDIVIETPNNEDLFKPENLRKIEALQAYLETLPNVGGTTSIVEYLKQMNRSLNEDRDAFYKIPDNSELISQYFLLYSASGDPTDFEEEIDYDYRLALVRARLNTGKFQSTKLVVEQAQKYIAEEFNTADIKASLSGRVYVDYEWLENLLGSHYKGVIFAVGLVWIVACISFKSIYGGSLALLPVVLSTLSVYALMGALGITLAVGTTMTAAIALGIGIDFAIHTLDRIKLLIKEEGIHPDKALRMIFPSTGRALLFNFLAVFIGFGLLGFSYVPPLSKLGTLIAFAVLISFLSSMTVLPALVKALKPRFLGFGNEVKSIEPQAVTANEYK